MAKQTFTVGQVLSAAQMTSLQQTAMGGGSATAKTASYTLVAADAGATVIMNSASATTITINTSLFSAGDTVFLQNIGAGISTITAGTATVNTASSLALAQYESGTLYFTAAGASIFSKADGAAASSGGMTLLSETVASAVSSLSFTGIAGTYKQLLFVWQGIRHSTTGSQFAIRLNNSSSSVYSTQMSSLSTPGGLTDAGTAGQSSIFGVSVYPFGTSNNYARAKEDASGYLIVDNYASSTKSKTYYGGWQGYDNLSEILRGCGVTMGLFNSTTAITSLEVVRLTGSATFSNENDTTIRLYGVA